MSTLLLLPLFTTSTLAAAPSSEPTIAARLDHVNLAVRDLSKSRIVFDRMGFNIKPGRLHMNSIDNLHMKFVDGTQIELITATKPVDSLAAEYLELLAKGDGGAFICLQMSSLGRLLNDLSSAGRKHNLTTARTFRTLTVASGSRTYPVWFIEMPRLWPDRASVTRHSNGATGIAQVWYSASEFPSLETLLQEGSAGRSRRRESWSRLIPLANGLLQAVDAPPCSNGSPLVGVVVRVRSLSLVRSHLRRSRLPFTQVVRNQQPIVLVARETTGIVEIGFTE